MAFLMIIAIYELLKRKKKKKKQNEKYKRPE